MPIDMVLESRILPKTADAEIVELLDRLSAVQVNVLAYHYPFYRDVLTNAKVGEPICFGCYADQSLVAILPCFFLSTEQGTVLSSLPFFGPNAGVICDVTHAQVAAIHRVLIQSAVDWANNNGVISLSLYSPFESNQLEHYYNSLEANFIIDKETAYVDIATYAPDSSIKYDIRKAEKAEVRIESDFTEADIVSFYAIYKQNCEDNSIPLKPFQVVSDLILLAASNNQVKVWKAMVQDEMIGGLICLASASTVSYYLPCSKKEYRTIQPMTLLIDNAIREAQKEGQKIWNWESSPSKDSGVYKFKKKWGSVDGTYKIYVKTFHPDAFFADLGKEKIQQLYPYFFTFPFHLLPS